MPRILRLAALAAALSSAIACATEDPGCPECATTIRRATEATCTPTTILCPSGRSLAAETCTYDDATGHRFVRYASVRSECGGDAGTCDAALANVRETACRIAIEPCAAEPCRNGGTCRATSTSFVCDCPATFTGSLCERDVDECATNPCIAPRVCVNLEGSHLCACPNGTTGAECDQDVNECLANPCQNGGTCSNTVGDFRCTCPAGFGGTRCEVDLRVCKGVPIACGLQSTCDPERGCAVGGCGGTPPSCGSLYSSYSCGRIQGCYWSYSTCYGTPASCRIHDTQTACTSAASGYCSWSTTYGCHGPSNPCSSYSIADCPTGIGCSVGAP